MVEIVPLESIVRQEFYAILGGQNFTLRIVSQGERTYLDAKIGDDYVIRGALCHDRVSLRQFRTRKMEGDFYFVDILGNENPYYTGFGSRFYLVWVSEDQALNPDLQLPGYLL